MTDEPENQIEPEPKPREVRAYFKGIRKMAASGLHVSLSAEGFNRFVRMAKARERYEKLGLMGGLKPNDAPLALLPFLDASMDKQRDCVGVREKKASE